MINAPLKYRQGWAKVNNSPVHFDVEGRLDASCGSELSQDQVAQIEQLWKDRNPDQGDEDDSFGFGANKAVERKPRTREEMGLRGKLGKVAADVFPNDIHAQEALAGIASGIHASRQADAIQFWSARNELIDNFVSRTKWENVGTAENPEWEGREDNRKRGAFVSSLRAMHERGAKGGDVTGIKGFDEMVEMAQRDYPILLQSTHGESGGGDEDSLVENLLKRQEDVYPPAVHSDEIITEALAEMERQESQTSDWEPPEDLDSIPFRKRGPKWLYSKFSRLRQFKYALQRRLFDTAPEGPKGNFSATPGVKRQPSLFNQDELQGAGEEVFQGPTGPQAGEMRVNQAGNVLVLRSGRWHRVDFAPEPIEGVRRKQTAGQKGLFDAGNVSGGSNANRSDRPTNTGVAGDSLSGGTDSTPNGLTGEGNGNGVESTARDSSEEHGGEGLSTDTPKQTGPAGITRQETVEKVLQDKAKAGKPDAKLTYDEAVACTYTYTGTKPQDWSAVPITGMADADAGDGTTVKLPVFDMPAGYSPIESFFSQPAGGFEAGGCCELCGHTIKRAYHIQNDKERATMTVGSECVTNFGEGKSGQTLAKEAQWDANRDLLRQTWDARNRLAESYGYPQYRNDDNWKVINHPSDISDKIYRQMGYTTGQSITKEHGEAAFEHSRKVFKLYRKLNHILHNSASAPVGADDIKRGNSRYQPASNAVVSKWVKKHGDELRELLDESDELLGVDFAQQRAIKHSKYSNSVIRYLRNRWPDKYARQLSFFDSQFKPSSGVVNKPFAPRKGSGRQLSLFDQPAPKEGDTRINAAGNTEILKNHRWHVMETLANVSPVQQVSASVTSEVDADTPITVTDESFDGEQLFYVGKGDEPDTHEVRNGNGEYYTFHTAEIRELAGGGDKSSSSSVMENAGGDVSGHDRDPEGERNIAESADGIHERREQELDVSPADNPSMAGGEKEAAGDSGEGADGSSEGEVGGNGDWNPAQSVKISADSIEQLRKQDVYRVLDSAPTEHLQGMADYITENRSDLAEEVKDALADIRDERGDAVDFDSEPEGAVVNTAALDRIVNGPTDESPASGNIQEPDSPPTDIDSGDETSAGNGTSEPAASDEDNWALPFERDDKRPTKKQRELAQDAILQLTRNYVEKIEQLKKDNPALSDSFRGPRPWSISTHYRGGMEGLRAKGFEHPTPTRESLHKAYERADSEMQYQIDKWLRDNADIVNNKSALQKELHENEQKYAGPHGPASNVPHPASDEFRKDMERRTELRTSLGKQPWQRTQAQMAMPAGGQMPAAKHRESVEKALERGENVPEEVLRDYPDLQSAPAFDPHNAPISSSDVISRDLAYNAHRGTSWVPDERATQAIDGYKEELNNVWRQLAKHADTPDKQAQLKEEWDQFKQNYKAKYSDWMHAKSRIVSSMIAGSSKFPVRTMERRNQAEKNKLDALLDFKKRAVNAITKKLSPEQAPVRVGDAGSGNVLQAKIAQAEEMQSKMKEANKIIRSNKDIDARLKAMGFSDKVVAELQKPDYMGRTGFPDYRIKNNGAEIRRLKKQLESQGKIEQEASGGNKEIGFDGGSVRVDYDDNRIRIIHDAKPPADVIAKLKQNGFRWSPSNKAWQRQITGNAKYAVQNVTGVNIDQPQKHRKDRLGAFSAVQQYLKRHK